ncbi:MAG TPA: methyltransferase domain-containing protein [Steroidobacteraceae bacterium]|nr:methyltransferase domain-containing protein [Steroidobacteraceae bacterium]
MRLLKEAIKRVLYRLGYQIVAAPNWATTRKVGEDGGYRLVSWRNADGGYDLAEYHREQEKGNRAKIEQIWTSEPNLRFICQWLKDRGATPQFILCHGTRNGFEQKVFNAFFQCEVIGTEISPTASQFPMTVMADFHEPKPEWGERADIVYSNSLDHAYDPGKALRAWAQAVKNGGVIVIEKASDSDPRGASDLDPFGITLPNLLVFLLEALGDVACIRAAIDVPERRHAATYHKMIVVGIDRRAANP